MEKLKQILSQVFTPGTPVSVIAWGLVGVVVAVLLLLIGFWRTLLICVCFAVGAFLGGVKDKRAFIGRLLDLFRRQER